MEHLLERTVITLRVPNILWAEPMTCMEHRAPSDLRTCKAKSRMTYCHRTGMRRLLHYAAGGSARPAKGRTS